MFLAACCVICSTTRRFRCRGLGICQIFCSLAHVSGAGHAPCSSSCTVPLTVPTHCIFFTRKLLCKRWLWLSHTALGAQVHHLPEAISFSFGCGAVPGRWLPDRFLSPTPCVAARFFPTASCWYLICLYLGWFLSHPQHSQIRFDPFLLGVGTVSSSRPQHRDSFPFCFPFSVCVWLSGSRQAAALVHRASAAAPCSE